MGLFDFFKKKQPKPAKANTNSIGEPLDRLTADGELPFGWVYRYKDFTDKISSEYLFFSKEYYESLRKEPIKKYAALKSLLLYIDDAKKLCAANGECFTFWFCETWAKDEEVQKMRSELKYIEEHIDELEADYKKRQYVENILIPDLKKKAYALVKESPGILQTDAYKQFAPEVEIYVRDVFRALEKEGKIKREKHGRTYKLTI